MTTVTEEKIPQYVHCKECKHERIAFYTPIAVTDLPKAKTFRVCPNCKGKDTTMMGRYVPTDRTYKDYEDWVKRGDSGTSSLTILFSITGPCVRYPDRSLGDTPQDPDDFRRCYLLLKAFPELRPQLPKVSEAYPKWKALVEHWDELEALLTSEIGDIAAWKEGSAEKTYYRMKELLRGEQ